jgi:uncharacterized protein YjiK
MIALKKAIILFFGIIINYSCSDTNNNVPSSNNNLELEASYDIAVLEPSGLAVDSSGNILYVVSDNSAQVYKLSTTGNVLQTYGYEGNDLEGVSTFTENKLLLTEERTKELVVFDIITGEFSMHAINYNNNAANSGIEGVTYDANSNTIFILNEKNPGLLIRLRSDFSVIAQYELDFANDYSGIYYESLSNNLWIVSDQSKTINKCTLTGEVIESYSINIEQAEGIAIANNKIYVVSDVEEKLYVFHKPID